MSPFRSLVFLVAVAFLASPAVHGAGAEARPRIAPPTVSPSLAARLAGADRALPVLITLRDQVPNGHAGRSDELIRTLRRTAEDSQPALLARFPQRARRLWLVNAVALRASPAEIRRLARDPAVARIEYDRRVRLFARAGQAEPEMPPGLFARGDWGLAAIGAPAVWRDYGLDGRGVRIGSIDTGVDADHPDLRGKVVAWRDFAHGRSLPYDDNGHGTHTIGTMVGGAAGGAPIGVAPGARMVVAKALDRYGNATLSTLLAAAEWIADPDGNPSTADFPAVVNASWGTPAVGDLLRPIIRRWRELGIVPVFAVGNSGPRGSVAVPAAYSETLAVGALGPRGRVAPFSSRGPAVADRAGWARSLRVPWMRKPDLVAPGVEVTSSVSGGGWASLSGTSMAAPHVAGAVALLHQADPSLTTDEIEMILRRTTHDVAPAADRRGGAGGLDVRSAVASVLGRRAAHPEISLIAVPPAVTRRAVLTFAVESGDARMGVWLDDARAPGVEDGPLVRVPVGTPGSHTIAIAALDPRGNVRGARRVVRVVIDHERPRLALEIGRGGLLEIGYRAHASDGVAGVARGSLTVRVSESPHLRGRPAGRHTFTRRGPYWVEAEVADRAGNVRRVRRVLAWPSGPLARRLAWNDAFVHLRMPFIIARLHRRFDGRYRATSRLTHLLAANCESIRFAPMAARSSRPPRGAVGVWSDGRGRVLLSTERAGRLYFIADRNGRLGRGVRPLPPQSRPARQPLVKVPIASATVSSPSF